MDELQKGSPKIVASDHIENAYEGLHVDSEASKFLQAALFNPLPRSETPTTSQLVLKGRSASTPKALETTSGTGLPAMYNERPILKQRQDRVQEAQQKQRLPLAPCNPNVSRVPRVPLKTRKGEQRAFSLGAQQAVAAEVMEWKEMHLCRDATKQAVAEKNRLEQELIQIKQQQQARWTEELVKRQKCQMEMVEQRQKMREKLLVQRVFAAWHGEAKREAAHHLRAVAQLQVVWTFRSMNRCFKGWRLWSAAEHLQRQQQQDEVETAKMEAEIALVTTFTRQRLLARFMFRWMAAWHTHERRRRLTLEHRALQGRISTALGKVQKPPLTRDPPAVLAVAPGPSAPFPSPRPEGPINLPPPAVLSELVPTPRPNATSTSRAVERHADTMRGNAAAVAPRPPYPSSGPIPTRRPTGSCAPLRRLQSAADVAFLTRLEQRSEARKQCWSALQQRYEDSRRKKREEEQLLQLRIIEATEQQQRQMLEEQKMDALFRQQQHVLTLGRQERARQAELLAIHHNTRNILRVWGWRPWRKLIVLRSQADAQACEHSRLSTICRAFKEWQAFVATQRKVQRVVLVFRVVTLTQYIRLALKRMAFGKLRMNAQSAQFRRRLALVQDERRVLHAALRQWAAAMMTQRRRRAEAEQRRCSELQALLVQADLHTRFLLQQSFRKWRLAHHQVEDQRLRQAFRQEAWQNVRSWLGQ
eukprot:GGOE01045570.1.p1 GENE.GGOE01045570.1~~GGOE01045570.1.p1  ORF type:complete len:745 (+),score=142.56 GGOE01045570.1:132-2237(+)